MTVDLLTIVVPLIVGVLLGYLLRSKGKRNFNKATFGIIIVLIFSLGFSIGSNNDLLISLPKVGLNTAVMLVMVLLFSILFVKIARKAVGIK